MSNTTFLTQYEYFREPKNDSSQLQFARLLKNVSATLAAWINPDTDTYRMRGQDTLTIGDQARWVQLKGTLATATAIQEHTDSAFDFAIVIKEQQEIVRLLTRAQTAAFAAITAAPATVSARHALRPGNNAAAIALLDSWLNDTSGYDQAVWQRAKAAIEENRLSERERFGD
ncbi:MAG: hypothetical protein HY741_19970 [Chloroflexi bacterium]|nr:hypothetical protein [Chloroflexota bacterium]